MFKIRYKPFFVRMEHAISALLPQTAPQVEATGKLTLTVVECRGLMKDLIHNTVYAVVGIGKIVKSKKFCCNKFTVKNLYYCIADYDWVGIYPAPSDPKRAFVIRDVICVKTLRREANLDFALTQ